MVILTVWRLLSFLTLKLPDHLLLPLKCDCTITAFEFKVSGLMRQLLLLHHVCGPNLKNIYIYIYFEVKFNNIKLTIVKRTIQWHLAHSHFYEVPKHFITPKGTLNPLSSYFPFPSPGNHQSAFCISAFTILNSSYKWNHGIWPSNPTRKYTPKRIGDRYTNRYLHTNVHSGCNCCLSWALSVCFLVVLQVRFASVDLDGQRPKSGWG